MHTALLPLLSWSIDPHLVIAGALVGLMVGLTGMGGGALLTPILVLIFGVPPLAAVSSDLVTSLVMKPFGGAIHLRKGTVNKPLLRWLITGAVPAAFIGSVIIGKLGHGPHAAQVQSSIKFIIAIALLASVTATVVRLWKESRGTARGTSQPLVIKPWLTVVIGAIGGLAVGLSSVGAGTLIIAMLLVAYPQLTPRELVGTDIVQAIPLVGAATIGHLLFGDVKVPLTLSLLLGAIPMVLVGAKFSSSAPSKVSRPIVSAILVASSLALLKASTPVLVAGVVAVAALVVALGRRTPAAQPVEAR